MSSTVDGAENVQCRLMAAAAKLVMRVANTLTRDARDPRGWNPEGLGLCDRRMSTPVSPAAPSHHLGTKVSPGHKEGALPAARWAHGWALGTAADGRMAMGASARQGCAKPARSPRPPKRRACLGRGRFRCSGPWASAIRPRGSGLRHSVLTAHWQDAGVPARARAHARWSIAGCKRCV